MQLHAAGKLAAAVNEVLGGADQVAAEAHLAKAIRENLAEGTRDGFPGGRELPIGKLMGGRWAKSDELGGGSDRHKALLFKFIVDKLEFVECSVACGVLETDDDQQAGRGVPDKREGADKDQSVRDHTWNIVRVSSGHNYLVDCTMRAGTLLDEDGMTVGEPSRPKQDIHLYHRIGGRNGMYSMQGLHGSGKPAAAAASGRRSMSVMSEGAGDEELQKLVRGNAESYAAHSGTDVEFLGRPHGAAPGNTAAWAAGHTTCDGCNQQLGEMCAILSCGHAFHMGCYQETLKLGVCTCCQTSIKGSK